MTPFSVRTTIEAAPETIWSLLTDASGYPNWNTTIARIEGRIALGEKIAVYVTASPRRAFSLDVVTYEEPARLVWRAGMPLGLFTAERTYELRARPDGVDFAMYESYRGLLAPLIAKSIPNLQPAFEEFADCLKARAEHAMERDTSR